MASDLCIYRAMIGCFYNRAANNHDKVFLVNYQWSHFIFYAARKAIIECLCPYSFSFCWAVFLENTRHSTSRYLHSEPQENRLQLSSLSSNLLQLLLLRSGDIESNPGPTPNYEIKIIHLNARSIPEHISDAETECNKYDFITCSEAWLALHHTSAQTDLLHFHPPIRLDR